MAHIDGVFSNTDISVSELLSAEVGDGSVTLTFTIEDYTFVRGDGFMGKVTQEEETTTEIVPPAAVFPFTKREKKAGAVAFMLAYKYNELLLSRKF